MEEDPVRIIWDNKTVQGGASHVPPFEQDITAISILFQPGMDMEKRLGVGTGIYDTHKQQRRDINGVSHVTGTQRISKTTAFFQVEPSY